AERISVRGQVRIGSRRRPFKQDAQIVLMAAAGDRDGASFVADGGAINIHAARPSPSWTRLAEPAQAGSNILVLEREVNWEPGDRIVVASTSLDPLESEEATVQAVNRSSVLLREPLSFAHEGRTFSFGGRSIDERAEVGLLSRNVQIRGGALAATTGIGGHIMAQNGGILRLDGVEFAQMGKRGVLGRYAVHFHMGEHDHSSYIKRSSIHHSFNRCVAVHGTHGIRVHGNVAFDVVGHCFFLEDGVEHGNSFIRNLGITVRRPATGDALLESDRTPAVFWISHPTNVFRGNVAVGAEGGFGYWYDLPPHPTGDHAGTDIAPRSASLALFQNNVAHSINRIEADTRTGVGLFLEDYSPRDTAILAGFTAYKTDMGIWSETNQVVADAALADNRWGIQANESRVRDSLVVGETANAAGRFTSTIQGLAFYSGKVVVEDVTFAAYQPTQQRRAGALGYVSCKKFSDKESSVRDLEFIDATPVFVAPCSEEQNVKRSVLFYDTDGSVAAPNAAIVADSPMMITDACNERTAWRASVCPHRYTNIRISTPLQVDFGAVTATRDDGSTAEFLMFRKVDQTPVAVWNVITNRTYRISFAKGTPSRIVLSLPSGRAGDAATLVLPYMDASPFVRVRGSDSSLSEAKTAAEVREGDGQKFFYDSGSRTLWVKLVVSPGKQAVDLLICESRC
ncbi:MAG: G8 domain-containing protein, partial [Actinomycetota bacterium]|nr:G8 domain-containing protein [Actinomycetota bacterium]